MYRTAPSAATAPEAAAGGIRRIAGGSEEALATLSGRPPEQAKAAPAVLDKVHAGTTVAPTDNVVRLARAGGGDAASRSRAPRPWAQAERRPARRFGVEG